jgi:diguanylate cyclase (GGDEF)-like protein
MNPKLLLGTIRNSLMARIFGMCFIAIHLPLVVAIVYLASGFASHPVSIVTVLLVATLVGTVACLSGLWWFIRPLKVLVGAIERYHVDGTPVRLALRRNDEVGVLARSVSSTMSELDGLTKKLRHQATTDTLTGLGNRRSLTERVASEQARAAREGVPVTVVLFDLDRFKEINDNYGHDVGDSVLMAIGEVVRDNLRRYDAGARIGGEEFCLMLPRTRESDGLAIADRYRKQFERTIVPPLMKGRITASFGVYEAAPGESLQQMLRCADEALYRSKQAGRNRVSRYSSGNRQGEPPHLNPF